MIWSIELFASLWFGVEVMTFLGRNHFDVLQRFFAGVPIGFFTLAWVLFLTSGGSRLSANHSLSAFSFFSLSIFALRRLNRRSKLSYKLRLSHVQLATLLFGGAFFVYLMHCAMLYDDVQTKGAGYSDLPFHLNIVSSFATGCNNVRRSIFDVQSIFFSRERLAYPFMTNFLTGALMATGHATLRAALFFPSALIVLSLLVALYSLSLEFTQSHVAAAIAVVLFANLGGLGFLRLLNPKHGYGDWVHNWGRNQYEYWFHPLMHVIVPQRASLWSLPLCCWTLFTLVHAADAKDWRLFALAGVFTGFTPLVQIHSYVALAQWSICFWLVGARRQIVGWAVFASVANVMAIPQFTPYLGRLTAARDQFVRLNPIWRTPERAKMKWPAITLWWRGLGVFWAMSLLGIARLAKRQLTVYVPSLVVYLVTNYIRYQPWELDNTKVFYAAWIPVALPVVANYLVALGKCWPLGTLAAAVLGICCCASSFIHTVDCFRSTPNIFNHEDTQFGLWVAENTDAKAIFLTSQWHAHPAATIAGRQLFMGYVGWVSSHGLDWWRREQESKRLAKSPGAVMDYDRYGIRYVISRRHEFKDFEANASSTVWAKIFDNKEYKMWRKV
jgi:hypothetical protein